MPRPLLILPFADAASFRQLALARLPAAFALDPVEAFGQAVAVHHQIVVGEGRRARQQVGAAHGERIEAERARHVVEQAFEGEADIDRAVAAKRAARRRVGEHALADDISRCADRRSRTASSRHRGW